MMQLNEKSQTSDFQTAALADRNDESSNEPKFSCNRRDKPPEMQIGPGMDEPAPAVWPRIFPQL